MCAASYLYDMLTNVKQTLAWEGFQDVVTKLARTHVRFLKRIFLLYWFVVSGAEVTLAALFSL